MQPAIAILLCAFLINFSVQARSIENQLSSDKLSYSKFLTYLKTREIMDNDDSASLDSAEDHRPAQKRGFFLFPTRRSSQRYRPTYTYGRKSHWDTFFG